MGQTFAKWQLPDAFVFVEALPRTSVGKFKKIALREQFADWKWEWGRGSGEQVWAVARV
ncbi:MAG: hypothetical protein WA817_22075 [Candidatus Acidiferrum sp.]